MGPRVVTSADAGASLDAAVDRRTRDVIAFHFDPDEGSPFWLARERELGLDARNEIRTCADLRRLGPFDPAWLRSRPLEDFVPRSRWVDRDRFVLAETGGTTGAPARAVFDVDEFEAAFGAPFLVASADRGFPHGGSWLFVGPSGPHVIGQAARLLARRHGALEPFSVDLDPRWARAQEPGSLGEALYRDHVLAQALDVLARESVDVLFVTPPLAVALAAALDRKRRAAIRGIHLGGMPVTPETHATVRAAFERAVILPGYGNSLFGILVEPRDPLPRSDGSIAIDYFPTNGALRVDVVRDERTLEPAAVGERGRVMLTRIDRTFLLPNVVERDSAEKLAAGGLERSMRLGPIGLRDPRPVAAAETPRGLY